MHLNWLENYNLLTFETIDSTNSEALLLASSGVSGDFVILSREQTGGRGQKGREWVSISGICMLVYYLSATLILKDTLNYHSLLQMLCMNL